MKILIGDIGNTLTKLCLVDETSTSIKEYNIETAKIIKEKILIKFLNPILGKNVKKNILFSSVVPKVLTKRTPFKLDTGMKPNIISIKTYRSLGCPGTMDTIRIKHTNYGKQRVPYQSCRLRCSRKFKGKFVV